MSLYRHFKTSARQEAEGVDLSYPGGVKIKIARAGGSNLAFKKAFERLARRYRRQLELEILPLDVQNKLLQEVYADTVVLGWEGVTDELGRPMEHTRDNVLKLFTDLPDLWADVKTCAENATLFREHLDELESKN